MWRRGGVSVDAYELFLKLRARRRAVAAELSVIHNRIAKLKEEDLALHYAILTEQRG